MRKREGAFMQFVDAHTDGDHVEIAGLEAAVTAFERIARALLPEASGS